MSQGDEAERSSTRPIRTTVHVVRHGEVHNPEKILYGRLPGYGLSDTGRQQAKRVAEHLAGADVTALLVSPMQRAQETAEPIAATLGLEPVTEDRLIEAANAFEGLHVSVGDGALRKPEYWPLLRNPFRPSWGEPYLEIAHRMLGAAHRARAAASGHEAVCVSHQLPIVTLRRFLAGQRLWHDPRKRECSLGSVTSFVFDDESLVDIAYTEPGGTSDPTATGA
ncbi:histidine phosphatase family protein [Actinomycetospora chlora]|uniref:Histidine phosphatase family protein n=1 Tax=Actinomycetospora chlora TaxID=663608 RepID=A0ABP9CJW8_9PSEU